MFTSRKRSDNQLCHRARLPAQSLTSIQRQCNSDTPCWLCRSIFSLFLSVNYKNTVVSLYSRVFILPLFILFLLCEKWSCRTQMSLSFFNFPKCVNHVNHKVRHKISVDPSVLEPATDWMCAESLRVRNVNVTQVPTEMPPWQSPTHSKDSGEHRFTLDVMRTKCEKRKGQWLKAGESCLWNRGF